MERVTVTCVLLLAIAAGFLGSWYWRADARPAFVPRRVSRQEAIAIANAHFGRDPKAGCYVRETDRYFVCSPPYMRQVDIDAASIYVEKSTGRLTESDSGE